MQKPQKNSVTVFVWLPESMESYYHYCTWILHLYIWGKKKDFFFVSSFSLQEVKWKMSVRHAGHFVIWSKDIPKTGEKMWWSIWEIISALYFTNMDKLRYLNYDIWEWIIIICNLSTKLKQKQWHAPGRYTICSSHSWKTIFSFHYNTVI